MEVRPSHRTGSRGRRARIDEQLLLLGRGNELNALGESDGWNTERQ